MPLRREDSTVCSISAATRTADSSPPQRLDELGASGVEVEPGVPLSVAPPTADTVGYHVSKLALILACADRRCAWRAASDARLEENGRKAAVLATNPDHLPVEGNVRSRLAHQRDGRPKANPRVGDAQHGRALCIDDFDVRGHSGLQLESRVVSVTTTTAPAFQYFVIGTR